MFPLETILNIGGKILDKVLPDPQAKAEAQAKLLELAQKGQMAELEAQVKEMDSARRREIEITVSANAPLLNKIVTPILALGTVGLSFVLFAVLAFTDVQGSTKDIVIYILGALSSAVTMVLGYYFGSSAGSKEKSTEIQKILTNGK